jgi:predicted NUDIX family NTP pyrophosphohydrolase
VAAKSAGLLPYRRREGRLEVLIAHMGSPFWARRDRGAWSIVKGEYDEHEEPLAAALREFAEETGVAPPNGERIDLGEITQSSRKRVRAWAVEADLDAERLRSNVFELEWPPRSGRIREYPEVDRFEWCGLARARERLVAGQQPLLDELQRSLGREAPQD